MSDSDKKITLILFWMNGCGPCNAFKPAWKNLVNTNAKYIEFRDYESAELNGLPESIKQIGGTEVDSFPTIKVNISNEEYEYNGSRTETHILNFIREKYEKIASSTRTGDKDKTEGDVEMMFGGAEMGENVVNQKPKYTMESDDHRSIFMKSRTDTVDNVDNTTRGKQQYDTPIFRSTEVDRLLTKRIDTLSNHPLYK